MLDFLKSLAAVLAVSLFLAGPVAADHVDHDSDVSEPFAAVGPLADKDLPVQAVAGSGRKLQRHGTRGFKSQKWAIDLPGRGRIVVQRKQQKVSGDGRSVTWLGNVEGAEGGLISVTRRDDLISGFIDDGQRYWVIENAGKGLYRLFEIDTNLTPPPANPLGGVVGAEPTGGESGAGSTQAADGTVIQDVLIAYTPEVTARFGGVAATETAIVNHVAAINQSYSNSQVDIQLNLVGTVETAQAQSGNMGTTLSRLRSTTDGYYDEVHPLRDQLGADLVAMLTTETGYCGIAYLNYPQSSGEDRYAFSVTSAYIGYACLPLTLGHEVGHNQGLCHNREEAGCSNPAYVYGYGYLSCGNFRTIMSYSCNPNSSSPTRIYNFANPNVLYSGTPTGIAHSVDPD
ncbi:MAG: M12 family metallo-peptidase, partial [Alphaproteobacteria bacterium]|nr:M12 family metallo-peptidase [Alphaproteobacteria bacterium]